MNTETNYAGLITLTLPENFELSFNESGNSFQKLELVYSGASFDGVVGFLGSRSAVIRFMLKQRRNSSALIVESPAETEAGVTKFDFLLHIENAQRSIATLTFSDEHDIHLSMTSPTIFNAMFCSDLLDSTTKAEEVRQLKDTLRMDENGHMQISGYANIIHFMGLLDIADKGLTSYKP